MDDDESIFDKVEKLKIKLKKLIEICGENINEENIKIKIVTEFLKCIGYNEDYFYYEDVLENNSRVDMCIKDLYTKEPIIYIEVKKLNYELVNKDYSQLANYLNSNNINWGILTNGRKYILFNNSINDKAHKKFVLEYTLFKDKSKNEHFSKARNLNNLKLFSYEYLIKNNKTRYFVYFADFRNKDNKENSYSQYKSTLYHYLNFLADNYSFHLNNINPDTFKNFLTSTLNSSSVNNKKTNHRQTIINKYSHVCSFYTKVIEDSHKSNPFNNTSQTKFLNDILVEHDLKEKENQNVALLTNEELGMLLSSLKNNRHDLRNTLIVLFVLYGGLDTNELVNLKESDLNLDKMTLTLKNRKIPLHKSLKNILTEYLAYKKNLKIKSEYLFCGKYNRKFSKISHGNMNLIINEQFNSIDGISEERKKILNSSFIKRSVIKNMINSNIPLQEIIKFTGLSFAALEEYITKEDINKVPLKNIERKHPYNSIFESIK